MLCALALFAFAAPADAAPGDLDPTFDFDGRQTTDIGSGGRSVAVQQDGKIVVAGSQTMNFGSRYTNGPSSDVTLVRYHRDGSLDTSFGDGGKRFTDFGTRDEASSLAIQADGKIVVAGYSECGCPFAPSGDDSDVIIARYNADGTLDPSFSGDGKETTDFRPNGDDYGSSVAIQPDGAIVVAGASGSEESGSEEEFDVALVRYRPDGSLDTSLGGDGKETTDFGSSTDSGTSVAIQADGRIVVAGLSDRPGTGLDVLLARYHPDGALDASFSGDGWETTDFGSEYDSGRSVVVQPDGRIVVAGRATLARYLPGGGLDTSFGGDGWERPAPYVAGDRSAALQADGKIVVGGTFKHGDRAYDFGLTRYRPGGGLDTSFGGDGLQTTDFGAEGDNGQNLALQGDGKIVVAGYTIPGREFQFAVARYEGGSAAAGPAGTTAPAARVAGRRTIRVSRRGLAAITLSCPAPATGGCAGTVTLRAAAGGRARASARGVVVGRARFRLDAGQRAAFRISLTRRGLALLRRKRTLRATAAVTTRNGAAGPQTSTATLRLRAPRR